MIQNDLNEIMGDLLMREPLNYALYNPTSILVFAHFDDNSLITDEIDQTYRLLQRHMSEDLLYHMVTTLIKQCIDNKLIIQSLNYLDLLIDHAFVFEHFKAFLHSQFNPNQLNYYMVM